MSRISLTILTLCVADGSSRPGFFSWDSASIHGVLVKGVRYTLDQSEGRPAFRSRLRVPSRSLNCVFLQRGRKHLVHVQSTLRSRGVSKSYECLVSVPSLNLLRLYTTFCEAFHCLSESWNHNMGGQGSLGPCCFGTNCLLFPSVTRLVFLQIRQRSFQNTVYQVRIFRTLQSAVSAAFQYSYTCRQATQPFNPTHSPRYNTPHGYSKIQASLHKSVVLFVPILF